MATPYITIGCPTTGGGVVLEGDSSFLVEGIPIACVGHKASCPLHKIISTIVSGDQYFQVSGRPTARAGDSLSCGCKLLPKQSLVVGDNGGSTIKGVGTPYQAQQENYVEQNSTFGQKFLIIDELTSEPLVNVCYEVYKNNGLLKHGKTDDKGYTEFIAGEENEEIELRIIVDEEENGNSCKCDI
nr:PAAR domain-containing protein [Acinetobacter sp. Marseille-Q1620]